MSPKSSVRTRLVEHYQLLEELGRGGFGVVHRARHRQTGELVAVKLWRQDPTPDLLARLEREARLVQKLDHPGLVKLLQLVWDDEGRPVLVYQLVEGEDLEHLLEGGPPPLETALGWLSELASALDALHAAGLLHRDLKPANVLRARSGRVFLADFGLLRPDQHGQTLTETGVIVGTPEYLAPECLGFDPVDHRADLYSLGCLAYHLLAGSPPFQGDLPTILQGHAKRPVPPLPAAILAGSPGLQQALAECLAKRPEDRPSTASELVRRLREGAGVRSGAGPGALANTVRLPPEKQTTVAPGPSSSRGMGRRAVVLGCGLLGVGLWVGWWLNPHHRGAPPTPTQPPPTLASPVAPEHQADVLLEELMERLREQLEAAGDRWVTSRGELLPADADLEGRGIEVLLAPHCRFFDTQARALPALSELYLEVFRLTREELVELEIDAAVREARRVLERFRLPPLLDPTEEYARRAREPIPCDFDFARGEVRSLDRLAQRLPRIQGDLRVALEALDSSSRMLNALEERFSRERESILPGRSFPAASRDSLWGFIRVNGAMPTLQDELWQLLFPLAQEFQVALRALPGALQECPDETSRECLTALFQRFLRTRQEFVAGFLLPLLPEALAGSVAKIPQLAPLWLEILHQVILLRNEWCWHSEALVAERERVLGEVLSRKLGPDATEEQVDMVALAGSIQLELYRIRGNIDGLLDFLETCPHQLLGPLPMGNFLVFKALGDSLEGDQVLWTKARAARLASLVRKAITKVPESPRSQEDRRVYLERVETHLSPLAQRVPELWEELIQALRQERVRLGLNP